jgi:hypothetical protein
MKKSDLGKSLDLIVSGTYAESGYAKKLKNQVCYHVPIISQKYLF